MKEFISEHDYGISDRQKRSAKAALFCFFGAAVLAIAWWKW